LAYDALLDGQAFKAQGGELKLTDAGARWFASFGIEVAAAVSKRRAACRPCLDWGERRHHLAGALGTALLERVCELGWARRATGSRVIAFTPPGERAFRALFEVPRAAASAR
jgi:hypothetical protein